MDDIIFAVVVATVAIFAVLLAVWLCSWDSRRTSERAPKYNSEMHRIKATEPLLGEPRESADVDKHPAPMPATAHAVAPAKTADRNKLLPSDPNMDLNVKLILITELPDIHATLRVQVTAAYSQDGEERLVGEEVTWASATTFSGTLVWNTTRQLGCTRGAVTHLVIELITPEGRPYGTASVPLALLDLDTVLRVPIQTGDGTCVVLITTVRNPEAHKEMFILKLPGEMGADSGLTQETQAIAEFVAPHVSKVVAKGTSGIGSVKRVVVGPTVSGVQVALLCLREILEIGGKEVAVSRYAKLNIDCLPGDPSVFSTTIAQKTRELYASYPEKAEALLDSWPINTTEVCTINEEDQTDLNTMAELLNQVAYTTDNPILFLLSPPVCNLFIDTYLTTASPPSETRVLLSAPSFSLFKLTLDLNLRNPIVKANFLIAADSREANPGHDSVENLALPNLGPRPVAFSSQPKFSLHPDQHQVPSFYQQNTVVPSALAVPSSLSGIDGTVFKTPLNPDDRAYQSRTSLQTVVSPSSEEATLSRQELESGGREVAILLKERQLSRKGSLL